ncbi:MAG: flagellar hook-length control protein FliK [Planctomycetota bacterium]
MARTRPPLLPEKLRDQILEKVRLHLTRGRAVAEIRLDPPELGRLSLEIEHRDGRIFATVRAEHDAVMQVLHRYVDDLHRVFADAGIVVHRFDIVREREEERRLRWRETTRPRTAGKLGEGKAGGRAGAAPVWMRLSGSVIDVIV